MLPPFMIDGRNTAEVFLANMNYAQVGGAVVTQEYIDGIQNDYLLEVMTNYPDRFFVCAGAGEGSGGRGARGLQGVQQCGRGGGIGKRSAGVADVAGGDGRKGFKGADAGG